jgi:hypothetical protein
VAFDNVAEPDLGYVHLGKRVLGEMGTLMSIVGHIAITLVSGLVLTGLPIGSRVR